MGDANNTDLGPLGNFTAYEATTIVAAIPTFAMILGSALVVYCRPSRITKAMLQNLSAGIILAAIGGELFPLLTVSSGDTNPWIQALAILLGFAAGAGLMFGLEAAMDKLNPEEEEDDDDDDGGGGSDGLGGDVHNANPGSLGGSLGEQLVDDSTGPALLPPQTQEDVRARFLEMLECLAEIERIYDRNEMDHCVHRVMALVDECKRKVAAEGTLLQQEEQAELVAPLLEVRQLLQHLLEHHSGGEFCRTRSVVKHLNELEKAMAGFHHKVETHQSKRQRRWRNSVGGERGRRQQGVGYRGDSGGQSPETPCLAHLGRLRGCLRRWCF